jgi:hypothetical protein
VQNPAYNGTFTVTAATTNTVSYALSATNLGPSGAAGITNINWLDRKSYIGFRVPSPDWEPRWPVDVAVVGDSFSFCYTQYPDCWVEQLSSAYGLSVVNLALPATGSVSHLRILDTFGLPYQPRVVVWQWWGNDSFEDTLLHDITKPKPGRDEPLGPCATPPPLEQWLDRHSAVSGMVLQLRCGFNAAAVDPYEVTSGQVHLVFGSPWFQAALDMTSKDNRKGWRTTQDALIQARKLAEDNGFEMVIVLVPAREEVYRSLTEPYLGADGVALYGKGRLMMLEFCQAQGLTCFDAEPVLTRHAEAGEQVYWPSDIHLNPTGNKILAEAVNGFLKAQGLIN